MIYLQTQHDDCLWHLILRGKQKEKKTPGCKVPRHSSNGRNNKDKSTNEKFSIAAKDAKIEMVKFVMGNMVL